MAYGVILCQQSLFSVKFDLKFKAIFIKSYCQWKMHSSIQNAYAF